MRIQSTDYHTFFARRANAEVHILHGEKWIIKFNIQAR